MADTIFSRIIGPGYAGTSTTSVTIGTGSQTFTTQSGLAYVSGERIGFYSAANPTVNFMEGSVTSYGGTTLVVNIDTVGGAGAHTDWNIGVAGRLGQTGATGGAGPTGPGYAATSTTSLTIGTGAQSATTQAGLAYSVGARVRFTSTGTGAFMEGVVTSYSGTTLAFTCDLTSGSGAHTDWNINLAGQQGTTGNTGAQGAGYGPATSATSLLIASGSTSFTTQAGLAYTAGARARASSNANSANYMEGFVTSYSGTTLVINVDTIGGSGTHTDWNINVSGIQGATGPSGGMADPGSNGIVKRTALNTTAVAAGSDLPVMVASGASHSGGAVPDPGVTAGTAKFLREDATWQVPTDVVSFTAPTLLNSWVNNGAPYANAGYYKSISGMVHIRGAVKSGTTSTAIFQLPVGFRPSVTLRFAIDNFGSYDKVEVDSSGNVTGGFAGNSGVHLDGIRFWPV